MKTNRQWSRPDLPTGRPNTGCDYALAPFDAAAIASARVWGDDRLVTLVPTAMAEKYGMALALMNAALEAGDADAVAATAQNCIKGMTVMDAAARAAGHVPPKAQVWWAEVDGRRVGFLRDANDWPLADIEYPGMTIYTIHEAAIAVAALKMQIPAIDAVQAAFPGTRLAAVRDRTPLENELDDEIPF